MLIIVNIREAWRSLRANALRSALTTLGIVLGVSAVITMIAIGTGTQRRIQEEIERLGPDTLYIFPAPARHNGVANGATARMTLTDKDARAIARELASVTVVAPLVQGRVHVVFGGANWATTGYGVTETFLAARDWHLEAGRPFSRGEIAAGRKVAIIGKTVASRLFPDGDAIGHRVRIAWLSFQIIGILQPKGPTLDGTDLDDIVVMPLLTARNHLMGRPPGGAGALSGIVVKAAGANISLATIDIRQLLRQRHRLMAWQEDDFRIQNMSEIMRMKEASSSALTQLLAAIASISLVVGGIGVMNVMLVSVTERTREIGIRAALGAGPGHLSLQFLVEAVTLSMLGAAVGTMLGIAATFIAAFAFGIQVQLTLGPILLANAFAGIVGALAGTYPAVKAARLAPVEALRYG